MLQKWQKAKISSKMIIILFIFLLFSYPFVKNSKIYTQKNNYEKMREAAKLMEEMSDYTYKLRKEKGFDINEKIDPLKTGLIGKEFTEITTTTGDLEAKQTALNPDFAGLLVDYFANDLNLKKGDRVAVGASGSFPGFMLAVTSAGEVLELDLKIVYSLGASNYGANIVGFTMADILPELNENNFISYNINGLSLGGGSDIGQGMYLNPRELKGKYENEFENFIYEKELKQNMKMRREIFQGDGKEPAVFVNIGGNVINYGRTYPDNGLILSGDDFNNAKSMIEFYLDKEIPVINLINIKDLAEKHGIKKAPRNISDTGEASFYYKNLYRRILAVLILATYTLLLIYFKRKEG